MNLPKLNLNKIPHMRIGLPSSLMFALISSAIITYFVFSLQPFPMWLLEEVLYQSDWTIVWLNFLPIITSTLILYFATNNVILASGTVGFIVVVLSVMNRFKIIFRHAPLTTLDFMLGAEFMGIAHNFTPRLIYGTIAGFVGIILAIAIAAFFVRNKPIKLGLRLSGLLASLAMAYISTSTLSDEELFNSLYVHGNIWRMENHFNSKGFLYAFIHTHLNTDISTPEGFDTAELQSDLAEASFLETTLQEATSDEPPLPHVFLILAEAFSEVSESEGISFEDGFNPLENYVAIRAESLHGQIVVPHYGGGTADTEFDILTGISTRNFRGAPFSNTLITRSFPGLVRILSGLGYHPQAMHPGFYWFYDRTNAFNFLGFDNFKSLEDFYPQPKMIAGYATEEATFNVLIERFQYHIQNRPNTPLFEKVITIQNHGPYEYKHGSFPVEFTSYPELLPNEMNLLSNYFYGLAMVDRELGRLVEYMRQSPEPVVIVYYSDHLPLLTRGILDTHISQDYAFGSYNPEAGEQLRDFTVPFIIWSNEAARTISQDRRTQEITLDTPISSFYLGALLLAYLGLEQADPFFYFLNNLRQEIPIQLEWHYFDTTGNRLFHSDEENENVRLYRHWSYYRLFN